MKKREKKNVNVRTLCSIHIPLSVTIKGKINSNSSIDNCNRKHLETMTWKKNGALWTGSWMTISTEISVHYVIYWCIALLPLKWNSLVWTNVMPKVCIPTDTLRDIHLYIILSYWWRHVMQRKLHEKVLHWQQQRSASPYPLCFQLSIYIKQYSKTRCRQC